MSMSPEFEQPVRKPGLIGRVREPASRYSLRLLLGFLSLVAIERIIAHPQSITEPFPGAVDRVHQAMRAPEDLKDRFNSFRMQVENKADCLKNH